MINCILIFFSFSLFLITCLITNRLHRRNLSVSVGATIQCQLGNKPKCITIDSNCNQSTPVFKKTAKDKISFSWPANVN